MSDTGIAKSQFGESDMALQDRLNAFKTDFETNKAPASVVAIMQRRQRTSSRQAKRTAR
jgi:hypothetical protein